ELQAAREIRVSGTRPRDSVPTGAGRVGGRLALDAHRVLPVRPVAVVDLHRDGSAGRFAATDTANQTRAIAFDDHAAAAAVAELPPREFEGDGVFGDGKTGRQTVDDHRQRWAVRLASSQKTQRHSLSVYEESAPI